MNLSDFDAHAGQAVDLMKLLSNKHRLMLLCLLVDDELSVDDINKQAPLSQSAMSQHLAVLREAGLVDFPD